MAIDPTKMAAFAETGPKGPPAPKAAGGPPAEEPKEDEKQPADGVDTKKFKKFIELLEENAEELEACCDELNPEALLNVSDGLPDEDRDILLESFGALPDDLQDEMIATLTDIGEEDAAAVTSALEESGAVEDGERVHAYLIHVGKLIGDGDIAHGDDGDDDADDADNEDAEDAELTGEEENDNASVV
jgi:hypothetical protein